ncbi:separase-like [Gossypium australe]|uniref:Separase-like n=1 Tax=Gossypium australe TaxID=47621 RepID=A0A5B6WGE6_9ROSI|nr:separase-like [Gossypium australe]
MATPTESSLLSDLQTSDESKGIHLLVSDYLLPISTLANSKKKKPDQAAVLSLAKQFVSFLSKSFRIIYKRIHIQNPNQQQQASLSYFFETYRLCITCLEFVSSQLAGGAHLVQIQRLKLVYCLQSWGRYDETESEALRVLERLRGEVKSKGKFVPGIDIAGGDSKFGSIVVRRWRLRTMCLLLFWVDAAGFLIEEINHFGEALIRRFCNECLAEYARSMMKDQVFKFASRICSALFSLERTDSSVQIDLVTLLLVFISRECKVDIDNNAMEFVELVDYCANKCRDGGITFCSTLAKRLNDMAGDFHQITGLDFSVHNVKLKYNDCTTSKGVEDDSAIDVLFLERDKLHNLSGLLGLLGNCCNIGKSDPSIASDVECKNSLACNDKMACLVMYYNTLKFLCQPLAELDAFYQFCDSFFSLEICASETKREGFDDGEVLVPSIIVAGFILSTCTKRKIPKSVCYIKQIIGSGRIQSQGLKYVYVSLYDIGVLMYRSKQIKEALKALKLSHRASWTNIQLLREMFIHKKSSGDHLSEDVVRDLVTDACTRSAFLLEVLHACGNLKVEKIIVESLENWSGLENLFRQLSGPMPLIKQWVKIQCKLHKNTDLEDSAPTLCCMLLSSAEVSKMAICKILEQELLAYQEMTHRYPDFCQRMQIKVIDLLLQDAYAIEDSPLLKARMLIRKGRTIRANGIEALKDCIWCLSEAISIMKNFYSETSIAGTPACHQLAAAYCLLALCTQEAEPNSEQLYQDIYAALDLWLSIFIPDSCFVDDEFKMVSRNTLQLLYNVLDLLSVKCRRLSHALCVSPVNESFITNLSEHCGGSSKSVDFWMHSLSGSQPGLLGFQQNLTCFFNNFIHGLKNHESDIQSAVSANNVNLVASELIASDPVRSHSLFLAGYLYYDLCERQICRGRLFEALVEKYNESGDIGEIAQTAINGPKNLQVHIIVASELWSFDSSSSNLCGRYLSPWNVLQCYLESILQVGCINEMIGNGVEAESFLLSGKSISCSQNLPLFEATFSSILVYLLLTLGKLYRKKRLWNFAEQELQSAKRLLVDSSSHCSCIRCRLMLEANLDQQLGDLFRNLFDISIINDSKGKLSRAEVLYKSALEKLNCSEWKNIICDAESNVDLAVRNTIINGEDVAGNTATQPEAIGARKAPIEISKHSNGNVASKLSDTCWEKDSLLGKGSCIEELTSEIACFCNQTKCWQCLPDGIMKSGLLIYFINMKWEYAHRKLLVRILTGTEDTKSTRSLWWMVRKKVDQQLGKLLRSLNTVHKKLVQDLKSKCKMDINESYLKLVLGAAKFDIEEACLSQRCLRKGCYTGKLEHHEQENSQSNGIDDVSALASQLIREAVNELHMEDAICRNR